MIYKMNSLSEKTLCYRNTERLRLDALWDNIKVYIISTVLMKKGAEYLSYFNISTSPNKKSTTFIGSVLMI